MRPAITGFLKEKMNIKNLLAYLVLSSTSVGAVAQMPMPLGIVPLVAKTELRFSPSFESRCSNVHKSSSFFSTPKTEQTTYKTFEDSGVLKLGYFIFVKSSPIQMFFRLKGDASTLDPDYKEVQTEIESSKSGERDFVNVVFRNLELTLSKTGGTRGMLQQGAEISTKYCDALPSTSEIDSTGHIVVLGHTKIDGRESIVFGGEVTSTCSSPSGTFITTLKGWEAVDIESGLPYKYSMTTTTGGNALVLDRDCVITGSRK